VSDQYKKRIAVAPSTKQVVQYDILSIVCLFFIRSRGQAFSYVKMQFSVNPALHRPTTQDDMEPAKVTKS